MTVRSELKPDEAAPAPLILAFDVAGSACSAAVGIGSTVLAADHRPMRHGHAEVLLPMVDAVMRRARVQPRQLQLIGVTIGPGGFTGIRTGLAAAHGIVLASRARLIGVTGFAAVAGAVPANPLHTELLVALDSRRADLYVQRFDAGRSPIGAPQAVLPADLPRLFDARARDRPLMIAGDATEAAAAALANAVIPAVVPDSAPDAQRVLRAALRLWHAGVPTEPMRPLYLRPPDVTLPGGRASGHVVS